MIGVLFYLTVAVSVALFGKIYHSVGLNDTVTSAMIMLNMCIIGYIASLFFIQRLIFLTALLFFPFNILFSTVFSSTFGSGLEPLGGTLLIIGFALLAFLRRL